MDESNKDFVKLKVPLVQQDLNSEETILEIAYSLECLEEVVKLVFDKVEKRLESGRTRLQQIQKRCYRARERVDKLKSINKSITVFSPAKYPVPSQNLFFENIDFRCKPREREFRIETTPTSSMTPNKVLFKEKMKFYHVKDSTQMLRKNEEITPVEGLGDLPENLKSVSSLLLFNTSLNMYDNYRLTDPLAAHKMKNLRGKSSESSKMGLDPAPASLTSSEPLHQSLSDYLYVPISQDVPDIKVPTDLPHLPGIAGDLRYEENVSYSTKHVEAIAAKEAEMSSIDTVAQTFPVVEDTPKEEESVSTTQFPAPPPPPPPPPPPAVEVIKEPQQQQPKIEAPKLPVDLTDSRASLMAAIRAAGGKTKPRSVQASNKEMPPPLTLMDDLHDKLLMRRKGILGKSEASEGGMLQQIATMIPPPPQRSRDSSEEDDPEWDD